MQQNYNYNYTNTSSSVGEGYANATSSEEQALIQQLPEQQRAEYFRLVSDPNNHEYHSQDQRCNLLHNLLAQGAEVQAQWHA